MKTNLRPERRRPRRKSDRRVTQQRIQDRKKEGLMITLKEGVQSRSSSTLLECVHLIHNALPELDLDEINTSTSFLGFELAAPILIDSMTGGTPAATRINGRLAQAAHEFGLGMGVGSQRAGLGSSVMAGTYQIVRKEAPDAFIYANIGGAQLAEGLSIGDVQRIIDMIHADAIAIHLNPLQEVIQPEGEPKFRGVLDRVKELSQRLHIPVIVKEVGAGISAEVAERLEKSGVSAINVAGLGGTSWAGVEQIRAAGENVDSKARLGDLLWDWGIPTAASLIKTRRAVKIPLISSGGLRSGVDVAKCIALGASVAGLAHPMLKHAAESKESLTHFIEEIIQQVRATMFLVGAKETQDLSLADYIITGPLQYWINGE